MFPRDRLQPEPGLEHEQAAIEIKRERLGSRLRDRLPGFGPMSEIGGRNESLARGSAPLASRPRPSPRSGSGARSARAAARDRDRAARSRPGRHSRSTMRCRRRAVDLGQGAEASGDLAIKLDALAGDELERAAHAALARAQAPSRASWRRPRGRRARARRAPPAPDPRSPRPRREASARASGW